MKHKIIHVSTFQNDLPSIRPLRRGHGALIGGGRDGMVYDCGVTLVSAIVWTLNG